MIGKAIAAICVVAVVAWIGVEVISGTANVVIRGDPTPRALDFKEAVLDAQSLANRQARVSLAGIYEGLSAEMEMLYPPSHTTLGFGDDTIRLLTEASPREVREYFYNCRQRAAATAFDPNNLNKPKGCRVRIFGTMTTCYLKINKAAQFPCLTVDRVESL